MSSTGNRVGPRGRAAAVIENLDAIDGSQRDGIEVDEAND